MNWLQGLWTHVWRRHALLDVSSPCAEIALLQMPFFLGFSVGEFTLEEKTGFWTAGWLS
jgi:hypothetical protein